MIRFISILMMLMLMSCYSIVSEFGENEEILSYTYYMNEGWEAFESINLLDSEASVNHIEQYDLALKMFNIAIQAIDLEYSNQDMLGPYYKAYNGIGWSQLYYANEFMNSSVHNIRDSLRNEAVLSFDLALSDLEMAEVDSVSSQDRCDIFLGYSYANYYKGLIEDSIYFDLTLHYSDLLLSEKSNYNFDHAQLSYLNVHYLRGKVYLGRQEYDAAYNEVKKIVNNCDPYVDDEIDINLLFNCFDQFINEN